MLYTVAQTKKSTLRSIAGSCPNSQAFLDLVNEGTERLIDSGDWQGLEFPIFVCAYGGCVVFPDFVGTVRYLHICRHSIDVHNLLWRFIPEHEQSQCWSTFRGDRAGLRADGYTPVFADIFGEGRLVRVYAQSNQDIGKTVTVFGTDNNGQVLRHQDDAGAWQEGAVIVLDKPFGSTNTYVRHIDRLILDEMALPVTLFAYNVAADLLEPIGEYQPGDTNPSFAKYRLTLPASCDCGKLVPLIAMIKVKYRPVRSDSDLVLIPKLSALKDICQSVKEKEARNIELADDFEQSAIRQLNLQLWNRDKENIPVNLGEFGNTRIGMQQVY